MLFLLLAGTAGAQHPLEPAGTSSPRVTLGSFLSITNTNGNYAEY